MLDLEKTAAHRVYQTELRGDAMVVTLQGDSPGFSIGAVHNEMATIVGLAKSPEVHNLIVDMSGSNYYGSIILGEIVNLGQTVREKGGRIAIAGISSDMKEILRMMRLDGMWERYPTLPMALRALGNLSWQEWLRPYAKPIAIAAGVLLLCALYVFLPRHDYTRDYYQEVAKLWDDGRQLRSSNAGDTDWLVFTKKAQIKLEELKPKVLRIAGSHNEAGRNLLYVVRDHAPKALERRMDPEYEETALGSYYLDLARAWLDKTDIPPRPELVEKALGADPRNSSPPSELKSAAHP